MGRRGPQPKDPDRRQRRNAEQPVRALQLIEGNALVATHPSAPVAWLKVTRDTWDLFWTTEVAQAVRPSDLPALERLFELRDEVTRLMKAARKERFVTGSMGQVIMNPAYALCDKLRSEIRMLEDRFGLSPSARARLGVEVVRLESSVADLTRVASIDDIPIEDPRSGAAAKR